MISPYIQLLLIIVSSSIQIVYNIDVAAPDKKPFRLHKYNALWEKIEQEVPESQFAKLESTLKKLDKEELSLKHQKAEGTGHDNALEKSIQEKLFKVLKQHNLLDKREIQKLNFKFHDEKLQEIWNDAVYKASIPVSELIELKEQLEVAGETLEKLSKAREETPPEHFVHENIVERFEKLHFDINNLREKVSRKTGDLSQSFTDNRVLDIWNKALTNHDIPHHKLVQLKNELEVLQEHIDKLKHWEALKTDLETNGSNDESDNEWHDQYEKVKKSIHRNKKIIKKLHMTMHETLRDEL